MAFLEDTCVGVHDYCGRLRNFLLGWKVFNDPTFTGTGNGTLEAFGATNTTANETWTITCTDATTEGSEQWSVVGSTSGNIGTATSYVLFDISGITFTIIPRSTAFIVSDYFTVVVTGTGPLQTSGDAGILNEHAFNYINVNDSYYQVSVSMAGAGSDVINITLESTRLTFLGRYDISYLVAPVYDSGSGIFTQPSQSPRTRQYCQDVVQTFRINADSYGLLTSIKSDTNYHTAYAGFIIPYCSPNAYPFPAFVGATSDEPTFTSATVNDEVHTFPWMGHRYNTDDRAAFIYLPEGLWLSCNCGFDDGDVGSGGGFYRYSDNTYQSIVYHQDSGDWASILPYALHTYSRFNGYVNFEPGPNGQYPLYPLEIAVGYQDRVFQILGQFRHSAAIYGLNIGVEDIIQADSSDWVLIQDIYRNGIYNHFALRKD